MRPNPRFTARPFLASLAFAALLLAALPAGAAGDRPDTRPKVGTAPPDVFGKDFRGDPVSLEAHRGKVVIITFWASWCGPCMRELPMLARVQQIVGNEHLVVLAVNYQEDRNQLRAMLRANPDTGLTWVHDRKGAIGERYGVRSLPNMFIVDGDGLIAARHVGYSEESVKGIIDQIVSLLPPEALSKPAGGP